MAYQPIDAIVSVGTTALHRELWRNAADSEGLKLSSWIRAVCNTRAAQQLASPELRAGSSDHSPSPRAA